jgi:addiction module RelB/DinJ family antitoxin
MAKTAVITTRIEPEIKEEAEIILEQLGMSMSQAISMYIRQLVMQRGLPFSVQIHDNPSSLKFLRSMSGIVNSGESDTSDNVEAIVADAIMQKYEQSMP